jgi:hypothetical protein
MTKIPIRYLQVYLNAKYSPGRIKSYLKEPDVVREKSTLVLSESDWPEFFSWLNKASEEVACSGWCQTGIRHSA